MTKLARVLVPEEYGGGFLTLKCEEQTTAADITIMALDKVRSRRTTKISGNVQMDAEEFELYSVSAKVEDDKPKAADRSFSQDDAAMQKLSGFQSDEKVIDVISTHKDAVKRRGSIVLMLSHKDADEENIKIEASAIKTCHERLVAPVAKPKQGANSEGSFLVGTVENISNQTAFTFTIKGRTATIRHHVLGLYITANPDGNVYMAPKGSWAEWHIENNYHFRNVHGSYLLAHPSGVLYCGSEFVDVLGKFDIQGQVVEGFLKKKKSSNSLAMGSKWQRRFFRLEGHVLTYWGKKPAKFEGADNTVQSTPKDFWNMSTQSFTVAKDPTSDFRFQIQFQDKKVLSLMAESKDQRNVWCEALQKEIVGPLGFSAYDYQENQENVNLSNGSAYFNYGGSGRPRADTQPSQQDPDLVLMSPTDLNDLNFGDISGIEFDDDDEMDKSNLAKCTKAELVNLLHESKRREKELKKAVGEAESDMIEQLFNKEFETQTLKQDTAKQAAHISRLEKNLDEAMRTPSASLKSSLDQAELEKMRDKNRDLTQILKSQQDELVQLTDEIQTLQQQVDSRSDNYELNDKENKLGEWEKRLVQQQKELENARKHNLEKDADLQMECAILNQKIMEYNRRAQDLNRRNEEFKRKKAQFREAQKQHQQHLEQLRRQQLVLLESPEPKQPKQPKLSNGPLQIALQQDQHTHTQHGNQYNQSQQPRQGIPSREDSHELTLIIEQSHEQSHEQSRDERLEEDQFPEFDALIDDPRLDSSG